MIAYFGVNGSTATAMTDDQTVRKWIGFSRRNGACKFIVGNVFGYRAKDVRELARTADPIGPDNALHIDKIIQDADLLVPCWGNRAKAPRLLWPHFDHMLEKLFRSGKPVLTFGQTKSGDPAHPLMLSYSTPLIPVDANCNV